MSGIVPTTDAQSADQAERYLKLTGAQKSLLFILSLDESVATRILANLSEEEVRALRRATGEVKEVTPLVIHAVHREFTERATGKLPPNLRGSSAYLKQLASKVFGEQRVQDLWDDRSPNERRAILDKFDAQTLIGLLEDEQPQTVAVVLSQLAAPKASEVLAQMPLERQTQVLLRLAKLQTVSDDVLREIHEQFAEEAQNIGEKKERALGGVDVAASLMKKLGNDASQALISELANVDSVVAETLRKSLFTFEDLLRLDARGMQALLKGVSTDQLIIALKTASVELREKIFSNLSSRAAGMLREELEMLGPVRISDVEGAQAAIVETALTLEAEGKIQIAREGQAEFV
jgi:flagellar motor switch protein FliG